LIYIICFGVDYYMLITI